MHKWRELTLSYYSVLVARSKLNRHPNIQQFIYIFSDENAHCQRVKFKLNQYSEEHELLQYQTLLLEVDYIDKHIPLKAYSMFVY